MKVFFVVNKFTRTLGASEDLVAATAVRMAARGPAPFFWFNFRIPENDPRILDIRRVGCRIQHPRARSLADRLADRLNPTGRDQRPIRTLREAILRESPELVVVNQGGNSDAWAEMRLLREMGIRYLVLCHSATATTWPTPEFSVTLRDGFLGSALACFVSSESRELTEAQIGTRLPRSAVVRSPCKFAEPNQRPWPGDNEGLKLACIARLEARTKGQDLILQAMSRSRWSDRDLAVTFFGDGEERYVLESLASSLGLGERCRFAGHTPDVENVWGTHHGFIQPSRYEGFGLSLLEACFCGRMSIVTPFPAAREFVIDGESGFMARNPSPEEVDDAMDRAWSARAQWRSMGMRALELARHYPRDPVGDFMQILSNLQDSNNEGTERV